MTRLMTVADEIENMRRDWEDSGYAAQTASDLEVVGSAAAFVRQTFKRGYAIFERRVPFGWLLLRSYKYGAYFYAYLRMGRFETFLSAGPPTDPAFVSRRVSIASDWLRKEEKRDASV